MNAGSALRATEGWVEGHRGHRRRSTRAGGAWLSMEGGLRLLERAEQRRRVVALRHGGAGSAEAVEATRVVTEGVTAEATRVVTEATRVVHGAGHEVRVLVVLDVTRRRALVTR